MTGEALVKFCFGLFILGGLAYASNKIADAMKEALLAPAESQVSGS